MEVEWILGRVWTVSRIAAWSGMHCCHHSLVFLDSTNRIGAVGKTWEYHLRYFGCYNTTDTSFFSETQSGEKCHQPHLQLKMKRNQIEKGETRSSLGSDQCPFHQNWHRVDWIWFYPTEECQIINWGLVGPLTKLNHITKLTSCANRAPKALKPWRMELIIDMSCFEEIFLGC